MIIVRRCGDPDAFASFLFPICSNEVKREFPSLSLTPDLLFKALASSLASWAIVEFFDTEDGVIVGAAAREPSGYLHIYVDSCRRASWAPHMTLEAALDIFLSDSESLYAAIPLTNRITISMVRKLGFIHTSTEDGIAFHVVTPQTRKRLPRISRDERRSSRLRI
jgi:hypothetical protein